MTYRPLAVRPLLVVLAVLASGLMVVSIVPGAVGPSVTTVPSADSPSAPETSSAPIDAAAVYSGSFATRAGYESSYVESVANPVPAVGSELVVVTFRPSDPSFFSPPPLGASPLSLAEIADRYGLSPAAYASAESYFVSMGLIIVHTDPDRLTLTVLGTASAVGRAFGTELESGPYEGRSVTFPATPPSLPAGVESSVAAVTGLSSGFVTFSLPAGLPGGPAGTPSGLPADSSDLISPAIAREIYDLSSLYNVSGSPRWASDQNIVLLLWGDGYDPSDLTTFFSNDYPSSFPKPTIVPVPVDGAPAPWANASSDPSRAPQELTLDTEWAGSMAPGATLDAVYAPDGPENQNYSPTVAAMTDALTEAVTGIPGVSVISMSFGTPEDASQSLAAAWATDLATATQEGITLLAATGDLGGVSGTGCMGTPSTDYPADDADVIAVGGTDPALARNNLLGQVTGLASESVWRGSGGGFSSAPAPSWQEVGSAAAPIAANGSHRGTPDVAATSAYNFLYYEGQDSVAAGTSFATPLWGGLIAEMDALHGGNLGFLTPRLYAVGAAQESGQDPIGLANVTAGSNCVYSATRGWDAATGWGSPRALLLYEDLTATFVNLTVSATPSPVAPGATVTVVARLSNRTNGAPIAGVPISVSLQSDNSYGPCSGVWGAEDLTSDASGSVSLAITVPACYLGSHGTVQVSVTHGRYYGSNSTTVDVNLLGFVPALVGIGQYPENVVAFAVIMGAAAAVGYVVGRGRPRPPTPAPRQGPPPSGATPPPATPAAGNPPVPPSAPPSTSPPPQDGPPMPPSSS